jgi:hypothetical protein
MAFCRQLVLASWLVAGKESPKTAIPEFCLCLSFNDTGADVGARRAKTLWIWDVAKAMFVQGKDGVWRGPRVESGRSNCVPFKSVFKSSPWDLRMSVSLETGSLQMEKSR